MKISRAFGDWNTLALASWCERIDALEIERIQVDQVGKNATDHRLLVDVGKILADSWEPNVRAFIIASGDGGFSSACKYIQEMGKQVIVIGSEKSFSPDLQKACDKFYFLEDLDDELGKLEKRHPIPPSEVRELFLHLFFAYHKLDKNKNDWVSFPAIGKQLRSQTSTFEKEFGKYKLSKWLKIFDKDFEIRDQMIRRIEPPRIFMNLFAPSEDS